MTVLDSLYVGLFGMSVIFVTLAGLSLLIRLQALVVAQFTRKKAADAAVAQPALEPAGESPVEPLKLINVDEKTAAVIMAIVCDDLQTRPEELRFLSIKALRNEEGQGRQEK